MTQPSDDPASDGMLEIAGFDLPPAAAWSERARRNFLVRLRGATAAGRRFETEASYLAWARDFRAWMAPMHRKLLEKNQALFPADIRADRLGGVSVQIAEPPGGAPASEIVLINLHGGAFVGGAECCGLVESAPLAHIGGFPVVCIDYRQGWEHRFPAASEDVEAVYRALLETHAPERIGLFGYSAGGLLVTQALAWFQSRGLPRPGAAAVCSAGGQVALDGGDSGVLAAVAMGGRPADEPIVGARFGYFAEVDPADPLASPVGAPEVLAQFPPTLVLTGGRSFDLSASLLLHRALLAAGVEAELHCWEGMWHCFPYTAEMPEAQDALRTLAHFFQTRLRAPSR